MEAEILERVKLYLGNEVSDSDNALLLTLIRRSVRRTCHKRYPFGYDDAQRVLATSQYQDVIFDAAIWYWAKQGVEGQSSHGENGISRAYISEDDLYVDIVPMAKVL